MIHIAMLVLGALLLGVCVLGFFRSIWQPPPRGPNANNTLGDFVTPPDPPN
jgi:hypothetical protein